VLEIERHGALVALEVQEVEAERRGVALDLLTRLHLDDVAPMSASWRTAVGPSARA